MATGVELATAWVRLVPSLDGAQGEIAKGLEGSGIDDAADEAGKKSGKRFNGAMAAAITAASTLVVGAVGNLFNDAIANASDLKEASTAVTAVFGDATPAIESFAQNAAKNLGQSQLEALNAAKTFGVFGQAAGLTSSENAAFSQSLTMLASDFASFHNVSPQEAIEAIGAGLRGEAEPLRKFGVLMDDASLKAKAMEMGIYDGNGALDQSQKILAAQALITEQAGAAQGDFARTSDGLANQQRILEASMTDLSATVGTALLPVMQGIIAIAQPVVQFFQENPSLVIALAVAVGVLAVALGIWAIAQWAINTALFASPITWIILAIVALVAAIVYLVLEWDNVVKWITEVWTGFVSWITEVINGFVAWWNSVWEGFASWIGQVWQGFVTWISDVWNGFISWIISVINGFVSWWNALWTGFGAWIASLWTGMVNGVSNIWNGFIGWIMGVVNGFVSWWNSIWSGIGDVINSVWGGVADFIGGVWDGIVAGIRSAVNSLIRIINGAIDGVNGLIGTAGAAFGLELKIPKIPMLAKGGTLTSSGHVIVGENGPELLKLPRGAQVNPNYDDLPAGDGRQHFTFNNYAPLGSTPSQELETFANRSEAFLP